MSDDQVVSLRGVITHLVGRLTKNSDPWAELTLTSSAGAGEPDEDGAGVGRGTPVTVFPVLFESVGEFLAPGSSVEVTGRWALSGSGLEGLLAQQVVPVAEDGTDDAASSSESTRLDGPPADERAREVLRRCEDVDSWP